MMSKKLVSLVVALLMVFSTTAALADTLTVTDMQNRQITLTEPVTRVVALTASNCEIICALGCEDLLVGRGEYCNYPASIADIPAVQSGWNTNVEEILALKPQVLILSDMEQAEDQIGMLEQNGVQVVITKETDIDSVYVAIDMIGTLLGRQAEAETLIAGMKDTFAQIKAGSPNTGKTVYFEVSPLAWGLYTGGTDTFMNEIAQLCGLTNAFADVQGWAAVSEEQILERSPDYIVSISGVPDAVEEIMSRSVWAEVTAIANGAVFKGDADAFSRPGPRLADAALSLYGFINDIDAQ